MAVAMRSRDAHAAAVCDAGSNDEQQKCYEKVYENHSLMESGGNLTTQGSEGVGAAQSDVATMGGGGQGGPDAQERQERREGSMQHPSHTSDTAEMLWPACTGTEATAPNRDEMQVEEKEDSASDRSGPGESYVDVETEMEEVAREAKAQAQQLQEEAARVEAAAEAEAMAMEEDAAGGEVAAEQTPAAAVGDAASQQTRTERGTDNDAGDEDERGAKKVRRVDGQSLYATAVARKQARQEKLGRGQTKWIEEVEAQDKSTTTFDLIGTVLPGTISRLPLVELIMVLADAWPCIKPCYVRARGSEGVVVAEEGDEGDEVWRQFLQPIESAQYQEYASTLGAMNEGVQSFHSLATVGIRDATAVCAALKLASPISADRIEQGAVLHFHDHAPFVQKLKLVVGEVMMDDMAKGKDEVFTVDVAGMALHTAPNLLAIMHAVATMEGATAVKAVARARPIGEERQSGFRGGAPESHETGRVLVMLRGRRTKLVRAPGVLVLPQMDADGNRFEGVALRQRAGYVWPGEEVCVDCGAHARTKDGEELRHMRPENGGVCSRIVEEQRAAREQAAEERIESGAISMERLLKGCDLMREIVQREKAAGLMKWAAVKGLSERQLCHVFRKYWGSKALREQRLMYGRNGCDSAHCMMSMNAGVHACGQRRDDEASARVGVAGARSARAASQTASCCHAPTYRLARSRRPSRGSRGAAARRGGEATAADDAMKEGRARAMTREGAAGGNGRWREEGNDGRERALGMRVRRRNATEAERAGWTGGDAETNEGRLVGGGDERWDARNVREARCGWGGGVEARRRVRVLQWGYTRHVTEGRPSRCNKGKLIRRKRPVRRETFWEQGPKVRGGGHEYNKTARSRAAMRELGVPMCHAAEGDTFTRYMQHEVPINDQKPDRQDALTAADAATMTWLSTERVVVRGDLGAVVMAGHAQRNYGEARRKNKRRPIPARKLATVVKRGTLPTMLGAANNRMILPGAVPRPRYVVREENMRCMGVRVQGPLGSELCRLRVDARGRTKWRWSELQCARMLGEGIHVAAGRAVLRRYLQIAEITPTAERPLQLAGACDGIGMIVEAAEQEVGASAVRVLRAAEKSSAKREILERAWAHVGLTRANIAKDARMPAEPAEGEGEADLWVITQPCGQVSQMTAATAAEEMKGLLNDILTASTTRPRAVLYETTATIMGGGGNGAVGVELRGMLRQWGGGDYTWYAQVISPSRHGGVPADRERAMLLAVEKQ